MFCSTRTGYVIHTVHRTPHEFVVSHCMTCMWSQFDICETCRVPVHATTGTIRGRRLALGIGQSWALMREAQQAQRRGIGAAQNKKKSKKDSTDTAVVAYT